MLLRADGSAEMGLGHISRMATLAAAARASGIEVLFAVHASCKLAAESLGSRGFAVATISALAGSEADAAETSRLAAASSAEIALVDGYQFGEAYFRVLGRGRLFLGYVDDLFAPTGGCDLVLNTNVYAEPGPYRAPAGRTLLLGPRYALLAASFVAARRPPRAGAAARLLVTFGGSDLGRQTEKVLASLAEVDPARGPLDVQVVLGAATDHASEVRALTAGCRPHRVTVVHAATDMAARMSWADLAITAGGTTCLELSCIGIPSLVIAVADNQRRVAEGFGRLGLMRSLGWYEQVSVAQIAAELTALREDPEARVRMVRAQHEAVDGRGAPRVVEAIVRASRAARGPGLARPQLYQVEVDAKAHAQEHALSAEDGHVLRQELRQPTSLPILAEWREAAGRGAARQAG